MSDETFSYQDGSHQDRTATIAGDGTLTVGSRSVQLFSTSDPGGSPIKGVTTDLAVVSYAVLGLFKSRNRTYGDRLGFELGGRKVIALFQEHPADAGKNYPHPGVTLLEPTGGAFTSFDLPALAATTADPAPAGTTDDGSIGVVLGLGALFFGGLVAAAALAGRGRRDDVSALNALHKVTGGERLITERNTGNYDVALVDLGGTGEEYVLRIRYHGVWGGDIVLDVCPPSLENETKTNVYETGDLDVLDAAAREWFRWNIRGDMDVTRALGEAGYDNYLNP